MAENQESPRRLNLDKGKHVPFTLRSPRIAQYIAAMSAEWQEAFEVEMAQRNESYLWPDPPTESPPPAAPSQMGQLPLAHPHAESEIIGDLDQVPYEEFPDSSSSSKFSRSNSNTLVCPPVEMALKETPSEEAEMVLRNHNAPRMIAPFPDDDDEKLSWVGDLEHIMIDDDASEDEEIHSEEEDEEVEPLLYRYNNARARPPFSGHDGENSWVGDPGVPIMFYSDEDEDDGRLIMVDNNEDKSKVESEDDYVQPPGSAEPEAEGGIMAARKDMLLSPPISSRSVTESECSPAILTRVSSSSSVTLVSASQPFHELRTLSHPLLARFPAVPRIQRNDGPPMGSLRDAMNDRDNEAGATLELPRPLRPLQMIQTSSAPASIPWLLPHPRASLRSRPLPIPPVTSANPAGRCGAETEEWRGNRLRPGVGVTLQPSSDVSTGVLDKRQPLPPLNSYNNVPAHTPELEGMKKLSHQGSGTKLSSKSNGTNNNASLNAPGATTRSRLMPQEKRNGKIPELPMTLQEVIEWNRNRKLSSPSSGSSSRQASSSLVMASNVNIEPELAGIGRNESGNKELPLSPLGVGASDSGPERDWEVIGTIPISLNRDPSLTSLSSEPSTPVTVIATLFPSSLDANENASDDTRPNTALHNPDAGAPGPTRHESIVDFRARDSEEREAKVDETLAPDTRDSRVPMDDTLTVMLSEVMSDSKRRKALEELKDGCAQLLVDFLHSVLLRPELPGPWLRKHTLITLYKLCRTSTLYPRCYVLKDITRNSNPDNNGRFCDIFKGQYKKRSICLKVVRVFQDTDNTLKTVAKEAILWGQLHHSNILPFYGIYFLDENQKQICLVSPWMDNGNINAFLKRHPLAPRKPLIYDIARGLEYLHRLNVIHGDLKGMNVLVNNSGRACIADFGLAFVFVDKTLEYTAVAGASCSYRWFSPELLDDRVRPSRASDVWAFGLVCYEVLTRQLPYYELRDDVEVLGVLLSGRLPTQPEGDPATELDKIDDEMWRLMNLCWAWEPQDRPTFEQILRELKLEDLVTESEDKALEEIRQESQDFRNAMKTPDTEIDLLQVEKILNGL